VPSSNTADSFPINIVLANHGDSEFVSIETGLLLDCIVKVRSKKGVSVPYTTLGSWLFAGGTPRSSSIMKYQPGDFQYWEYDLVDAFERFKPGEYLMSLQSMVRFRDVETKQFSRKLSIVTNEIPFTITEPNALEK
jgi:hypothetical protein